MAEQRFTLVSDVRDFLRGAKQSADALAEVSDSLDALAHEAQRDGEKIGDNLADGVTHGVKDADRALDKVDKALDDTARDAQRDGRKIGDGLADGIENGVKDADRALDKVDKALDDTARDAKRDGEKIGDGLAEGIEDGAKDATREVDKLEKSFRELAESTKAETKKVGAALGKETKEGAHEAEEGLDEFKDEANSTAREAAASFDGSADSIIDAFQEVAANAFAGFGPAGAAAGIGVAVGIGMGITALQSYADQVNEAKEDTLQLAGEIVDAGGDIKRVGISEKMREWATSIKDTKEWWEIFQDSAVSNLDKVKEASKAAGTDTKKMFMAMSGYDAKSAVDMVELLSKKLKEKNDLVAATSNAQTTANGKSSAELQKEADILQQSIDTIKDRNKLTDEAIKNADFLKQVTEEQAAAEQAAADAEQYRADRLSDMQGAVDETASSWDEYHKKESNALDPKAYLKAVRDRAQAASDYAQTLNDMQKKLSPEAYQYLVDQGIDFAPMLQSIIKSGLVDEFNQTFTDAAKAGNTALDKLDKGKTVDVDADTKPAKDKVDQVTKGKHEATVKTKADTKPAKDAIDTASKDRNVKIKAHLDKGNVPGDLDRLTKERSVKVKAHLDKGNVPGELDRLDNDRHVNLRVNLDLSAANWQLNNFVNRSRTATVIVQTKDKTGRAI